MEKILMEAGVFYIFPVTGEPTPSYPWRLFKYAWTNGELHSGEAEVYVESRQDFEKLIAHWNRSPLSPWKYFS